MQTHYTSRSTARPARRLLRLLAALLAGLAAPFASAQTTYTCTLMQGATVWNDVSVNWLNENNQPAPYTNATSVNPVINGPVSVSLTVPRVCGAGGHLQLTFQRLLDRTDLTLTVVAADDFAGAWTDLAQSINGGPFTVITSGTTIGETGAGNTRAVTIADPFLVSDPAHRHRFLSLRVTNP